MALDQNVKEGIKARSARDAGVATVGGAVLRIGGTLFARSLPSPLSLRRRRRLDLVVGEPFVHGLAHTRGAEGGPALALVVLIGKDVFESTKRATAVERHRQLIAQRTIGHSPCEIDHPIVFDG